MEPEAKIISKHNLDCSTLENLANDIANRLGCNIEYGQYQIEKGNYQFNILGTAEVVQNDIISTLYDLRNDENSNYNFVLELGEQAKIIYEDFIDFMPPWEEQYENVENSFEKKGLSKKSYYFLVFEELKKLGADKVYVIKDTFARELAIPENATLESYLKIIKKETTFFEVVL